MSPVSTSGSPRPRTNDALVPPASMIERMTAIIDAFDDPGLRLTLEEIAARTGLPRSTTHRILDQLVQLDWVERGTRGYALGPRALGRGSQRTDGNVHIRHAAAPHLHDLQVRTGLVVHLSELDGADVVYLDKLGGRSAAAVPSRVGERAPAHSTAGGKAILSLLPDEQVETLLHGRLPRRTAQTICDPATLRQELQRVRQRHGLAFEHSEAVPGVGCVAAPVCEQQRPVAAISLCGELGIPQLERLAPLVLTAARDTTRTLHAGHTQPEATTAARSAERWSPETLDRFLASAQSGDWI